MYISYDHYRVFYYVAKYGSFTHAAEVLYNSQPNLTRAIKALEDELGCMLFTRSNKGVKLTEAGEKLYEHIAIAFEHISAAEEEISLERSMQRGIVSIGASEIALRCFLLPILNQYRQRYPGIRIKIANVSTPQALSMLKDGLIDIAVVTTPVSTDAELIIQNLKSFSEVAICGEEYRQLSENTGITIPELTEYPIISLGNRTSTFAFYFRLFMKYGHSFSPDIEAATADQIIPLVSNNLGIGFVPEEFLEGETKQKGIYRISIKEAIPQREICLLKKKKHIMSLPAKELERIIVSLL